MISAIGRFIGEILRLILPEFLKQGREPRDVDFAGYDSDLQEDIDSSIENDLGFLNGSHMIGDDE